MNWIGRYVAQIRLFLPESNRSDVAEEIASLLHEQVEDRERQLGRKLEQQEMLELLKSFGHPFKVAAAYRGGGSLISESLFPLYALVIRYLVIILLALYAVSVAGYYLSGREEAWLQFSIGDFPDIGLFYFALTTIGFHLADRYLQTRDWLVDWDPQRLPAENARREPLFSSAVAVFFLLAWLVILSQVPVAHSVDVLLGEGDNRLYTFVLWLKLQVLITLPVYIWLMFQPHWTTVKHLLIMIADSVVIVGALICLSIDGDAFSRVMTQIAPDFQPSISAAVLTNWILGLWILVLAWDVVTCALKIRQEWGKGMPDASPGN